MNASDVETFFEAAAGDWDTMRLTYCHLPSHPREAGVGRFVEQMRGET